MTDIIQKFENLSKEIERSHIEQIKKANKLLKKIIAAALSIALLAVITALVAILFRKEPEPQIMALNTNTGEVTVFRSLQDAVEKNNEVMDKYWLSKFVEVYEEYDWFRLSSNSETIKLMSEPAVFDEYNQKIRAANSPLNILQDKGRIKVSISGTSFSNELAFVRFTTEKLDPSGKNTDGSPVQSWVATIAYTYDPKEKLTSSQRRTNPLSLKVQSYKVSAETSR